LAERYGKAFAVGLAAIIPDDLENFLKDEGFIVIRSTSPKKHAIYIDQTDFSEKENRVLLERIDNLTHPVLRLWRWPRGYRSAFSISAEVCAIYLRDFIDRTLHF